MFLILQSECGGPSCHVCFNLQPFWGRFAFNSILKSKHHVLRQCTILMVCSKLNLSKHEDQLSFWVSICQREKEVLGRQWNAWKLVIIWSFEVLQKPMVVHQPSQQANMKKVQKSSNLGQPSFPDSIYKYWWFADTEWIVVIARWRQNICRQISLNWFVR